MIEAMHEKRVITLSIDYSDRTIEQIEKAKDELIQAFEMGGYKAKAKPILRKSGAEEERMRGYWIEFQLPAPKKKGGIG